MKWIKFWLTLCVCVNIQHAYRCGVGRSTCGGPDCPGAGPGQPSHGTEPDRGRGLQRSTRPGSGNTASGTHTHCISASTPFFSPSSRQPASLTPPFGSSRLPSYTTLASARFLSSSPACHLFLRASVVPNCSHCSLCMWTAEAKWQSSGDIDLTHTRTHTRTRAHTHTQVFWLRGRQNSVQRGFLDGA